MFRVNYFYTKLLTYIRRRLSWFKTTLALSWQYLIFSAHETYEKIRKPTTHLLTSSDPSEDVNLLKGLKKKKGNTTPSPKKIGRFVNSVLQTSLDRCGSSHRWTGDSIRTEYEGDILKGVQTFSGRFSHFWEQLIAVIFTGGNSSQVSSLLYKDGEDSLTVLFSALQYVDVPDGGIPSVHWDHGSHDEAQITKGG